MCFADWFHKINMHLNNYLSFFLEKNNWFDISETTKF